MKTILRRPASFIFGVVAALVAPLATTFVLPSSSAQAVVTQDSIEFADRQDGWAFNDTDAFVLIGRDVWKIDLTSFTLAGSDFASVNPDLNTVDIARAGGDLFVLSSKQDFGSSEQVVVSKISIASGAVVDEWALISAQSSYARPTAITTTDDSVVVSWTETFSSGMPVTANVTRFSIADPGNPTGWAYPSSDVAESEQVAVFGGWVYTRNPQFNNDTDDSVIQCADLTVPGTLATCFSFGPGRGAGTISEDFDFADGTAYVSFRDNNVKSYTVDGASFTLDDTHTFSDGISPITVSGGIVFVGQSEQVSYVNPSETPAVVEPYVLIDTTDHETIKLHKQGQYLYVLGEFEGDDGTIAVVTRILDTDPPVGPNPSVGPNPPAGSGSGLANTGQGDFSLMFGGAAAALALGAVLLLKRRQRRL
jgi:LPXTG-motif cell wall-anchored protein